MHLKKFSEQIFIRSCGKSMVSFNVDCKLQPTSVPFAQQPPDDSARSAGCSAPTQVTRHSVQSFHYASSRCRSDDPRAGVGRGDRFPCWQQHRAAIVWRPDRAEVHQASRPETEWADAAADWHPEIRRSRATEPPRCSGQSHQRTGSSRSSFARVSQLRTQQHGQSASQRNVASESGSSRKSWVSWGRRRHQ